MDGQECDENVILSAPNLYLRPTYFRQTRKRGKVYKTVEERYIRDDLGFGCYFVDNDDKSKRRVKDAIVGKPLEILTTSQLIFLGQKSMTMASTGAIWGKYLPNGGVQLLLR